MSAEMRKISSWKEVGVFEGKVVALETDSFLLNGKILGGKEREAYALPSDKALLFGLIREADNQEFGYRILRVLKINAVASALFLTDSLMPLSMREAKREEIKELVRAISIGDAKLDHILDKKRAIEILQSKNPFSSFVENFSKPPRAAASHR